MSSNDSVEAAQAAVVASFSYVCRLCLGSNDRSMSQITPLAGKIEFVTKLAVSVGDGLPAFICSQCIYELNMANVFIHRSITSNTLLRSKQPENLQGVSVATPEVAAKPVEVARTLLTVCNKTFDAFKSGPQKSGKAIKEYIVVKPEFVGCSTEQENIGKPVETESDQESVVMTSDERLPGGMLEFQPSFQPSVGTYDDEDADVLPSFPTVYCPEPPASFFEITFRGKKSFQQSSMQNLLKQNNGNTKMSSVKISRPKLFTCNLCDEAFSLKTYFNLHMRSHAQYEPPRSKIHGHSAVLEPLTGTFETDDVEQETLWQDSIPNSLEESSGGNFKTKSRKKSKSKMFTCSLCDESFSVKTYFNLHMRSHTKFEALQLKFHGKSAASKGVRKRGVPKANAIAFPCVTCGKKFARMKNMLKHAQCHGKEARPFKCSKCGDKFAEELIWKLHVKGMHNDRCSSRRSATGKTRLQLRLTKVDLDVASAGKVP